MAIALPQLADAETWTPAEPVDIIFANAVQIPANLSSTFTAFYPPICRMAYNALVNGDGDGLD